MIGKRIKIKELEVIVADVIREAHDTAAKANLYDSPFF